MKTLLYPAFKKSTGGLENKIPEGIIEDKEILLPVVKKVEKDLIIKTLTMNKGSQKKSAEDLGWAASTLSHKLKKYRITLKDYKTTRPLTLLLPLPFPFPFFFKIT